jgi:hypothetical protein
MSYIAMLVAILHMHLTVPYLLLFSVVRLLFHSVWGGRSKYEQHSINSR